MFILICNHKQLIMYFYLSQIDLFILFWNQKLLITFINVIFIVILTIIIKLFLYEFIINWTNLKSKSKFVETFYLEWCKQIKMGLLIYQKKKPLIQKLNKLQNKIMRPVIPSY